MPEADKTDLSIFITESEGAEREVVARFLDGEVSEWGGQGMAPVVPMGDHAPLYPPGYPYHISGIEPGASEDLAKRLAEAAPVTSFVMVEWPAEDERGDLRAYTPDLGEYHGPCDGNGDVVFTYEEVTATVQSALASFQGTPADAQRYLEWRFGLAMGYPWTQEYQKQRDGAIYSTPPTRIHPAVAAQATEAEAGS
jgi:hypothetical protein